MRSLVLIVLVGMLAGGALADSKKPQSPAPSRATPKDYACAPGTADRKSGVCVCPAGNTASRDTRDFAVCVGAVMADPCTDAAQLDDNERKADAAMGTGNFASALASYELVVRCKPGVLKKAYLAACRARAFPKAQAYFVQLPAASHETLSMICIKEGYDPRPALVKSPQQSACACPTSVGVPVEETYCGYLVCGTDRQIYRCTNTKGISPWVLVDPVQQCPAPGRLPKQPAQIAEDPLGLGLDCYSRACTAPAKCVSYRGARGPYFKTCEIQCADTKSCPGGAKCMTIADGPGRVCR